MKNENLTLIDYFKSFTSNKKTFPLNIIVMCEGMEISSIKFHSIDEFIDRWNEIDTNYEKYIDEFSDNEFPLFYEVGSEYIRDLNYEEFSYGFYLYVYVPSYQFNEY